MGSRELQARFIGVLADGGTTPQLAIPAQGSFKQRPLGRQHTCISPVPHIGTEAERGIATHSGRSPGPRSAPGLVPALALITLLLNSQANGRDAVLRSYCRYLTVGGLSGAVPAVRVR